MSRAWPARDCRAPITNSSTAPPEASSPAGSYWPRWSGYVFMERDVERGIRNNRPARLLVAAILLLSLTLKVWIDPARSHAGPDMHEQRIRAMLRHSGFVVEAHLPDTDP